MPIGGGPPPRVGGGGEDEEDRERDRRMCRIIGRPFIMIRSRDEARELCREEP